MYSFVKTLLVCLLTSIARFSHATMAAEIADIVFVNEQIEALNTKQPKANAVAIKDEKFIAIGSNQKIQGYRGDNTIVVDLKQN